MLLKIRQQALVELLLVQRRLEVKLQPIALFIKVPHMRRGREHQRAGYAKVGEHKLPYFGNGRLFALGNGKCAG